jgi:hypothetical protein
MLSLSLTPNANAGIGGGDGEIKVKRSADGKSARANTGKPGDIVYPQVTGCSKPWTVPGGTTVVDGKTVKLPDQRWRRCPGYDGGRGVGQPFPLGDGTPDTEETAVIRPEEPSMRFHGAWYSQRPGYVWIDPAYGTSRTVAMQGDPGEADLVLEGAIFDPGISTKNGLDAKTCTREEILKPYDPSLGHYEQETCGFTYLVSSTPGKYTAKLRLLWRVTEIRFTSGARSNPPGLILESDSPTQQILVEEIQVLVPCKSLDANGCG